MTGIEMPAESVLQPGPHRDLVAAIHKIYDMAGQPAFRVISRNIQGNNALPATASHDTVGKILRGLGRVPTWQTVESLTRALAAMSVQDLDVEAELKRIHGLWRAARRPEADDFVSAQRASRSGAAEEPRDEGLTQIVYSGQLIARWESPKGLVEIYDRQFAMDLFGQAGDSNA